MRLTDLRVVEGSGMFIDLKADLRPALISDLIAALIEEGGTVMDSDNAIEIGWFNREPRRYLVFRIPDEETE